MFKRILEIQVLLAEVKRRRCRHSFLRIIIFQLLVWLCKFAAQMIIVGI